MHMTYTGSAARRCSPYDSVQRLQTAYGTSLKDTAAAAADWWDWTSVVSNRACPILACRYTTTTARAASCACLPCCPGQESDSLGLRWNRRFNELRRLISAICDQYQMEAAYAEAWGECTWLLACHGRH